MSAIFLRLICLFLLSVGLFGCSSSGPSGRSAALIGKTDYPAIAAQIDSTRIDMAIRRFAAFGTRTIGTAGEDSAASYIAEAFRQAGLEGVEFEPFAGAAPVDEGASIRVLSTGETLPVHCFWPNLVRTPSLPSAGVEGVLHYVGKGAFRDFNGKVIEGNFVLMDFNSGTNWLNAAELGARGVFFIEPDETVRQQAEEKFLQNPADVPRFYISKTHAASLLARMATGEEVRIRTKARMVWKRSQSKNVLGMIPGTHAELKNEVIVIGTHYDAVSVVPAIAPGANQAAGIASLLEIARMMAKNPPARTVYFLATSGHYMASSGINAFIQRHIRKHPVMAARLPEPLNMKLYIGLDLSSQRNQMGVSFTGWLYTGDAFDKQRFFTPFGKSFTRYAAGATEALGYAPDMFINAISPIGGIRWDSWFPGKWGADGELVFWAGFPSIYLATVFDQRNLSDTPLDLPKFMNIGNIVTQTKLSACLLYDAVNDLDLLPDFKMDLPDGLGTLKIQAVEFDQRKGFIPKTPLPGAVFVSRRNEKTLMGVRNEYYQVADENGVVAFDQLQIPRRTPTEAYVLDDDSGEIIYAPDRGPYGDGLYPITVTQDWVEKEKKIVLFRCEAVDVFDLVDPRYLTRMKEATVLNAADSTPLKYGHSLLDHGWFDWMSYVEACGPIFMEPGERFKLLMGTSVLGNRLVLTNATPENPMGTGYTVSGAGILSELPYRVARDMWTLNDYRLKLLRAAGIANERLEEMHAKAGTLLKEAEEAKTRLDWEAFIQHARAAWGYESRAYPDATSTANDLMKGVIFYMFLILPFSYFVERLLFGFVAISRRIAAVTAIFLSSFILLVIIHPAFKLASTPYIILLSFITFTLAAVVTWLLAGRFGQEMGRIRRERTAVYQTDVSRSGVLAAAFSLGISNMRYRPLRVALTCITIILLMFTVISFTSIRNFLRFYRIDRPNTATYEGLLVRNNAWWPLEHSAVRYMEGEFERQAKVVPRAWYASQPSGEWSSVFIKLERGEDVMPDSASIAEFREITAALQGNDPVAILRAREKLTASSFQTYSRAIMGLSPDEPEISGIDTLLIAGTWFTPEDRNVCILPEELATLLNIKPEDIGNARILLYGKPVVVKGIIDSKKLYEWRDLDDGRLTPVDYRTTSAEVMGMVRNIARQTEGEDEVLAFTHMLPKDVLFMPYQDVRDMNNGNIMSVAVKFPSAQATEKAIDNFMPRVGLTLFVGMEGQSTVYSALALTSLTGMENLFIPILVAALIVLNTMMGAVYERFREIGIFSSVGLAPTHIGALFMAESCVYAIIGGMAGYLIGQTFSQAIT
ncbi:MAG: M28 family peptidase, partial [candidate division Zixibacteria bacterium]|nr:M28 family peptidase [candidate division Zixibacteria bacterium]